MKKLLAFFSVIVPIMAVLVAVIASLIVGHTVPIAVEDVRLSTESVSISGGESTYRLKWEIIPKQARNRRVIFTSSNEDVAVVDQEGNVTFTGFGTAFVKVTTVDGNKSRTCEFNRRSNTALGINLEADKKEILLAPASSSVPGDSARLTAQTFPASARDKEVKFVSLDPSIAVVDPNGVVTPVSPGTVTITASSEFCPGTAIDITVARRADGLALNAGGRTDSFVSQSEFVDMEPVFSPADVSEKYRNLTYSVSDSSAASVDGDGRVVFKKRGKVTVKAETAYDVSAEIVLYYTGGLPSGFSCDFPAEKTHIYDETDAAANGGRIEITFPEESSLHEVRFRSSNEKVAAVNASGRYELTGGGFADITAEVHTARVENGELETQWTERTFRINCVRYAADIDAPPEIYADGDRCGIYARLVPEGVTERKIEYTLKSGPADVDEYGNVLFTGPGKAEIELSAAGPDGTRIVRNVTVVAAFNYPRSCAISMKSSFVKLNASADLAAVFPDAASGGGDGEWSVSDPETASLTPSGRHCRLTGLKPGKTKVKYSYKKWDDSSLRVADAEASADVIVYEELQSVTLVPEDLEKYTDGTYYTAEPAVTFVRTADPASAAVCTEFSCEGEAIVDNAGNACFRKPGTAFFTVTCRDAVGNPVSKTVPVVYTGGGPKSASVADFGDTLWVRESREIKTETENVYPANCHDPVFRVTQSGDNFVINGNRITAVRPGTGTIYVTYAGGFEVRRDVEVRQQVEGIEVSAEQIPAGAVTAKEVVSLSVKIRPMNSFDSSYTLSVDDESVATVGDGKLTFLKAGRVTVTAAAGDGRGATGSVSVESTYDGVKDVTIPGNSFLEHTVLPYFPVPSDFDGTIEVGLSDVSPDGAVTLDSTGKRIIGGCAGTAKVTFKVGSFEKTYTVTVVEGEGGVLSFDVPDMLLKEGDTADVSIENIVTDIEDEEIKEIYLNSLLPEFSSDGNAEEMEFSAGTVTARRCGIYVVTAKLDNCEKTFRIAVTASPDCIGFSRLSDLETDEVLSLYGGSVITGAAETDLGECAVSGGAHNATVSFEFTVTGDADASVNAAGRILFGKAGTAHISARQILTPTEGESVQGTDSDHIASITYYDKTVSFVAKDGDNPLSTVADNVYQYGHNNRIDVSYGSFVPRNPSFVLSDAVLDITSETPNASGGDVLNVAEDGSLAIAGGGKAVLTVTINGRTNTYDFEIIRKAESISVSVEGGASSGEEFLTYKSVIQLTSDLLPADTTDRSVLYSVSDTETASVDETGKVTFAKAGAVTVTASAGDGSGVSATVSLKSTFGGISGFDLLSAVSMNKGEVLQIAGECVTVYPEGVSVPGDFVCVIESAVPNNGAEGSVATLTGTVLTADCGGKITVSVSADTAFGEHIEHTLTVTVHEAVQTIELDNPDIPDKDENGRYVLSAGPVTLTARILPATATDAGMVWSVSDETVAEVDGNGLVSFKTAGVVTVTVKSHENPSLSRELTFHYTAGKAIGAEIVDPVPATMNKGETFTVSAKNVIPTDILTPSCEIEILSQTVNNGADGNVLEISGNKITAAKGGAARIKITVCGYTIEEYDVSVKSPATGITLAEESAFIGADGSVAQTCDIAATLFPADTHEHLVYTVRSGDGVSVDGNGHVTLTTFTTAVIRVSASESSSVYKDFTVTYKQRVLDRIEIDAPDFGGKEALFGGEVYTLTVRAFYVGETESEVLSNTDVSFSVPASSAALCTVNEAGKITAASGVYGEATATATYKGKSHSRSFVVAPVVDTLELIPNSSEAAEKAGIKGERVFGIRSFKTAAPASFADTEMKPDFQMRFTTGTNTYGAPLVWTSSDESVATVNGAGLLTRKKAGTVTITCRPKYRYNNEEAFYTFKLKDAVDVENIAQFEVYTQLLTTKTSIHDASKHKAVVLHCDIVYDSSYVPNFWYDSELKNYRTFRALSSIYGNGHKIDGSKGTPSNYKSPMTFQLYEDKVIMDNVTLIGAYFKDPNNPNVADFKGTPETLAIRGYSNQYACENIKIANSEIKGGNVNVSMYSVNKCLFTGCVIKNAYEGNLVLNTFGNLKTQPCKEVTVKNCAFECSLMPSVNLKVDKPNESMTDYACELIVDGDIYINNWRKKGDVPGGLSGGGMDATKILKGMFDEIKKKSPELFVGDCINLGISIMALKMAVPTPGLESYLNGSTVTIATGAPAGNYLLKKDYETKIAVINTGYLTLYTYQGNANPTLPGMSGPITPGSVLDSSIYPSIRDTSV